MRIEDIKDAYNEEYNNICYKFNCKIKNKNFTSLDEKESFTFIKKIINTQYGFEIKKEEDVYKMIVTTGETGNLWNTLFEYKNNKVVDKEGLHDLICPVNIGENSNDVFIED
jgi:hypothetical protein